MAVWSPVSRNRLCQLKGRLNSFLSSYLSRHCMHIKDHGGVKAAVRRVHKLTSHASFVARFDIYHYYQRMNHAVLLEQLKQLGIDYNDYMIVKDYLSVPDNKKTGAGLIAGGSLSPLLAAVYLHPLDKLMTDLKRRKKIVHYTRYMDDFIILCHTRWQLRVAIAKMHRVLAVLQCRVHPNKRFIGATTRGFDFLGYQFQSGRKLRPSKVSLCRFYTRIRRLHEQGVDSNRLLQYMSKWHQWYKGGLKHIISHQGGLKRHRKRSIYYLKSIKVSAYH
jgi:RNA-directed DNA polymerase